MAYIDEYRGRFGVEPICRVLTEHGVPIAPSTYYHRKAVPVSDADLADAYAVNALVDVHRANRGVYGIRKCWHALRRYGQRHGIEEYVRIGRDQVARLMRLAGLAGVVRGQHHTTTTRAERAAERHPDLINRAWATPTGPDQWWVADFTYVWTLAGFCYVSFITDVYSRRILGWRVTTTKTTPLVSSAVEQALFTRRRGNAQFTATGIVHHSDAGSQYTSFAFTDALRDAGITGSIGSVGDALDNALMESAIGLYKTELINQKKTAWTGRADVETDTAGWVHWYNTTRLHSALDYATPVEHEDTYHHTTTVGTLPAVA